MSTDLLEQHRLIWNEKPVLRTIYTDYYQRIVQACTDSSGPTLEIGAGSGNLKAFRDQVIATDIVPVSWLDLTADAQSLPFTNNCFANIVGVDVLHHIERPIRFFQEAERVLIPGGRIILLDPAITPLSSLFYRFFHPEPVDMKADPLLDGPPSIDREPFDANQAIPSLLFKHQAARFHHIFPTLELQSAQHLSLFAYPLSGGFRRWSLLPGKITQPLLRLEDKLVSTLGRLMAFRLLVVIQKRQ